MTILSIIASQIEHDLHEAEAMHIGKRGKDKKPRKRPAPGTVPGRPKKPPRKQITIRLTIPTFEKLKAKHGAGLNRMIEEIMENL